MEVFKDVVGYEGRYAVGNLGSVKSLKRTAVTWRAVRMVRARLLKPAVAEDGRLCVVLYANGAKRTRRVHQLVAEAFIGPCPEGMDCCHNDGDPANNAASNLRYDTRAGNQADRTLHGTHNRGVRNSKNKLTEPQVLAIRADPRTQSAIAVEYGINPSNVSAIQLRRSWAWL